MCHFCHRLKINPTAPPHSSENCRDPRNQFSKFHTQQSSQQPSSHQPSSQQPSSHQPSSQPSRLVGIPWRYGHGPEAVQKHASKHDIRPTSSHATSGHAFSLSKYYNKIAKIVPVSSSDPSCVFYVVNPRGCVQVMKDLQTKNSKQSYALVLAANAGRPGGSCSKPDGKHFVPDIEALTSGQTYSTQEESVLSTLALINPPATTNAMKSLYLQYGMRDASGSDTLTHQRVDYTEAEPIDYLNAWSTIWNHYDSAVLLVVACAPNAGSCPKNHSSTMRRTYNEKLSKKYSLFLLALEYTVYASLLEAKKNGYLIVIIPAVGCGIYAGDHKDRISSDFKSLLNRVINGNFSNGSSMESITGLTIVFVTLE